MSKFPVTKVVAGLPASVPFVGPEIQERQLGREFIARLGANENIFGPSPKAISAMQGSLANIWKYGDSESHDLRQALAEFHGVGFENIVIGEGIDGLLGYTCRLFVEPGRKVVTSKGAYPTFNYHVAGNGGELHLIPFKDNYEDLDLLASETTRLGAVLAYCSNPNNPMGTWHKADEINKLSQAMPVGSILVLDEAYMEFAPAGTAPDFDLSNQNVLRYRTFSKAYGLAGARIGYCIGHAGLIAEMEKVRNHFGINRVGQAGALAALADNRHLQRTLESVVSAREKLKSVAQKYGFTGLDSAANFVAIDCGRDENYAKSIVDALTQKAVFIRMPVVSPQSRFIRVSVGPDEDIAIFDRVLGEVLKDLN